jgi:hypothetical protein
MAASNVPFHTCNANKCKLVALSHKPDFFAGAGGAEADSKFQSFSDSGTPVLVPGFGGVSSDAMVGNLK